MDVLHIYHHRDAASSQEDGARQLLTLVVDQFRLELDEAQSILPKVVNSLDIDLAELVGRISEWMIFVRL